MRGIFVDGDGRSVQKMKTYHIISNPVAGKNKSAKNLTIVQSVFEKVGAKLFTHTSHYEHDATEIARQLTGEGETEIIAMGGDGTLHEVLNGVVDPTKCNLGLIPMFLST